MGSCSSRLVRKSVFRGQERRGHKIASDDAREARQTVDGELSRTRQERGTPEGDTPGNTQRESKAAKRPVGGP
jgi:hypothetical protein